MIAARPAHRSFVMSVLYHSVDLVETYQTSHRPNVHWWSKSNLGRCGEIAEEPFRRPNSEWSVKELRCLGADESYLISILGDTVEMIGANLLPSRLSLCGDYLASRPSPDSWSKQSISGANRIDASRFELTPVHISVSLRPVSRLPQTSRQDRGSQTRCCQCTDLNCLC